VPRALPPAGDFAQILASVLAIVLDHLGRHPANVRFAPERWGNRPTSLHDGFRIIARKTAAQVRLYSRPGNDLTRRFPLIVATLARLRSRSCIIDGEAVACDDNGVASFDLVRHHRANERIFLYAFDLILTPRTLTAATRALLRIRRRCRAFYHRLDTNAEYGWPCLLL
jgi:hypothetical protein